MTHTISILLLCAILWLLESYRKRQQASKMLVQTTRGTNANMGLAPLAMGLQLTCFLIFATTLLSSQSIPKTVLASAGGVVSTAEYTIGFTIGEPIIGGVYDEIAIDQGFWAGSLVIEPITAENELDGIKLYPNPVETELNIFTNSNPVYAITMFSVDGKRTLTQNVDPSVLEHKINLNQLSKGMYILQLHVLQVKVEGPVKTKLFKIIKN